MRAAQPARFFERSSFSERSGAFPREQIPGRELDTCRLWRGWSLETGESMKISPNRLVAVPVKDGSLHRIFGGRRSRLLAVATIALASAGLLGCANDDGGGDQAE